MIALLLIADLQGVTDVRPKDTDESPYLYSFRVQCTSCREVHANWISFGKQDRIDLSGSKGDANFVWRCKNCKRESSASIVDGPKPYPHSSPPKKSAIVTLNCRGLEFVEFKPDGPWLATGIEKGTPFDDINLEEDWFDYDEKASQEVSIKEMRWEIGRA